MDGVITAFPGDPAAPLRVAIPPAYGLQPDTTPALKELVHTLHETLATCRGHAAAAAARAALRGHICNPKLLATAHRQGDPDNFRRHLLYAAPDGSLSLVAIVWLPGQVTPIHGHTAWGAVGVCEGNPFCENFDHCENEHGALQLRSKMRLCLKPGDLATVRPGIDDLHRIGNASRQRAITLHAYGRDLLASPRSLNIVFNQ